MKEEDVKKFFEEIGLTKGLENMKKFQEEFIDKHYIEKQKVKEAMDNKESDLQRRILNASGQIRGKKIIDEPLKFKQNPLAVTLYHHRLLKKELGI